MTARSHAVLGGIVVTMWACACLPSIAFECSDASQCSRHDDGRCDAGNCSYPDPTCASQRRYSDLAAPAVAGRCVMAAGTGETSSSSSAMGDSSSGAPIPADWWECAWKHRARVSFAGTPGPALVDFTVLVAIDHTALPGAFADGGADLRFVDDDVVLAHEIERFDASGTSLVWVRVPELRTGVDDGIALYWDNPDASPLPATTAWDEHHVGVWHLGADVDDSSPTGAQGSDDSAGPTPAVIGDGRSFTGMSSINVGSPAPLDDLFATGGTVLAWVRIDSLPAAGMSRIVGKSLTDPGHQGWKLYVVGDDTARGEPHRTLAFQRDGVANPAAWSGPTAAIPGDGQWQLLALTFCDDLDSCGSACVDDCGTDDCSPAAGIHPRFFVDGEPVLTIQTRDLGLPWNSDTDDQLVIGRGPDGGEGLAGAIDELRVSRTVRCDSWIRAEQLSTTGALAQLGAAETAACGG